MLQTPQQNQPQPQPQAQTQGGPGVDPRTVAADMVGQLGLPDAHVRMNPNLGMAGVPSWFWVDNYDGQPYGASRSVSTPPAVDSSVSTDEVPADDPRRQGGSVTVEVRIFPTHYHWSFGDGAGSEVQSLGHPYPAPSDVQHRFASTSQGFPVELTITFGAEYRVNGGGWQALPGMERTYRSDYQVQQAQTVLVGPR
jgi:hypothetical protein